MPLVQPDTTGAQQLTPIDAGTYPAKIVACTFKKSKDKGTPMVVPDFEISLGNGKTQKRSAWIVIEGAGSWNFDQLLRAVHMDKLADQYRNPDVSPKPPFDTDTLLNQELMVVVEEELYSKVPGQPAEKRDKITGYLRK